MGFITSLFGDSGLLLKAAFSLGVVIVLIVLALWVFKLVSRASTNIGRGRNRRLAVVDTLAIDPKRQLVIIRRDNVEHLIITGGPQDLLVETGIPVEEVPVTNSRRPVPSVPAAAKPMPRPAAKPAPQPVVKPAVTAVAAPVAAPAPIAPKSANSVTALDRLRDLGKPANERRPTSLRHTGLMRPVSQGEAAPLPNENTAGPAPDSAKEIVNESGDQSGQTELGDSSDTNGYTADRN